MSQTKETANKVQYLTRQIALVLLADTAMEPHIRKAAQEHKTKLTKQLPVEARIPLFAMAESLRKMASYLAKSPDIRTLEYVHHLIDELIEGRVYMVDKQSADDLDKAVKSYENGESNAE